MSGDHVHDCPDCGGYWTCDPAPFESGSCGIEQDGVCAVCAHDRIHELEAENARLREAGERMYGEMKSLPGPFDTSVFGAMRAWDDALAKRGTHG